MRQTLILDSTQITDYHECPQKWQYSHVQQLTQIGETRDSMNMGSYGHKLLERYYKKIALGSNANQAYESVATANLDCPPELPLSEERQKAVREKFMWYHCTYGLNGKDIVPACEPRYGSKIARLRGDPPIITPLVEIGFSHKLLDTPEYLFVLEGVIDLIGTMDGMRIFVDHKFQERKRNLYKKSVQFRNYALVTGLRMGMVNYVRMTQKIDAETYSRDIINFSPQEMRAWKEEVTGIFLRIAKDLQSDPERRWGACSGKFGYKCEFTQVCEEFNSTLRESMIATRYTKKPLWRPWK